MEKDQTLEELLAEAGTVPPATAASIMCKLLDRLHTVHDLGGVHGRLRPADVHGRGGELEVTGFHREAGASAEGTDPTAVTDLPGAPLQERLASLTGLEPPEQILHPEKANARTDIYSAGAIFYLMLTGEPPQVEEDKEELAEAIVGGPPFVPSSVDSSIPREYDRVVLKALEKHPDDRFRSAAFMKGALESAMRGERNWISLKSKVRYKEWPWSLRIMLVIIILQIAYLVIFDPARLAIISLKVRVALGL